MLPELPRGNVRVVLMHPGEYILPDGRKTGRYADKKLRERGVELHAKIEGRRRHVRQKWN